MSLESNRLPQKRTGVWNIWRRSFLQFRRSWLSNTFWILLEPLFILLALGYGLGAFVSNIQGVAYIDFFFPSLLCITSMMVAFFESTYGNFSKLTHQKIYSVMIQTPLEVDDVVLGEVLWGATKGTLSAAGVALIAGIFGHLTTLMVIPALLVVFVSSFLFSILGMLVISMVKNYDGIIYPTSGLIIPMSLLSGTYFPIEHLPYGLQYFAYLFPLTHTVAVVRGFILGGTPWWQIFLHICYLVGASLLLLRWAIHRMDRKLII